MSRRRSIWSIPLTAILVACSSSVSPAPSGSPSAATPSVVVTPPPAPTPPLSVGGTLKVGLPAKGDNAAITDVYVDPHRAPWQDSLFRCCLARTLLSYNGRTTVDGGTVLRPDLAEALPDVSADGLTWTFRLRSGLRYGPPYDDTGITSRDVIRGIERSMRGPDGPVEQAPFFAAVAGYEEFIDGAAGSLAGLEAPDERTLVVRLSRPDADIATALSMPVSTPVPEGAADGHETDYGHFFVASGPYMYEGSGHMVKGGAGPSLSASSGPDAAVLVRNPSWDRATDDLRGAIVDRIEFSRASSLEDDRARLTAGTIDIPAYGIEPEEMEGIRNDSERSGRVAFATFPRLWFLPMNMGLPPFDDVNVRRAVNLVIDRAALAEARVGAVIGTTMRVARHAILDSLQDNLLLDYDPYPSVDDHGDLEAARKAMASSRYDVDKDGRCDAGACRPVPYIVHPATSEAEVAIIRADLADLGIDIAPRTDDANPYEPASRNGMFMIPGWGADTPALGGFIGVYAPPLQDGDTWISLSATLLDSTPAQLTGWGYDVDEVPGVDAKRSECLALLGSERFVCAAELDQLVMEQAVAIVPIAFPEVGFMYGPRVGTYAIDQAFTAPALDQIALQP